MSEFEEEYDYEDGTENGVFDEDAPVQDDEAVEETEADEVVEEDFDPEYEAEEDAEANTQASPAAEQEADDSPSDDPEQADEALWDKTNRAARLLRNRRGALQREKEERGGRPSLLVRGIKLLELKPKMTQKEMADLLGVKLHELDEVLADAEKRDIIARVEPEEPDLRKIVVMADEDSLARAQAYENRGVRFVPGLTDEEEATMLALLDKVIDKLTAMGLDDEREKSGDAKGRDFRGGKPDGRGNRGGFGGRRDDRGGRDNRDNRGSRSGFGGSRGNYRSSNRGGYGNRGGFGGKRDDRGGRDSRGGYGNGSRGGFGGNRNSFGGNRGGRDDRSDRGGYRGNRY